MQGTTAFGREKKREMDKLKNAVGFVSWHKDAKSLDHHCLWWQLFPFLYFFPFHFVLVKFDLPWYNRNGWLSVKHQVITITGQVWNCFYLVYIFVCDFARFSIGIKESG